MADDRQKGVVNVDSEPEGLEEEEVEDEEYIGSEELELNLSLGQWGWPAGSSSRGSGKVGDWLSPLDLTVGSSTKSVGSDGYERGASSQYKKPKLIDFALIPAPTSLFREIDITPIPSLGSDASGVFTSKDCTNVQASLFSSETASSGRCRDQDDDSRGHSMNFIDGIGDDGDKPGTSNIKDVEIKMDLTEDLLHLVFSFLSHKNLCKAGATCKQWQVASMHEDFWRCLNFKDTEISQQNFWYWRACIWKEETPSSAP